MTFKTTTYDLTLISRTINLIRHQNPNNHGKQTIWMNSSIHNFAATRHFRGEILRCIFFFIHTVLNITQNKYTSTILETICNPLQCNVHINSTYNTYNSTIRDFTNYNE